MLTRFTKSFLEEALEKASKEADSHKSREALISMSPQDFLSMAEPGINAQKLSNLKDVAQFDQVPRLQYDLDTDGAAQVVGHEGRHRAQTLINRGETEMPVSLRGPIRFDQQDVPNFDYREDWPSTLKGETSGEMPFPIKKGQSGTLASIAAMASGLGLLSQSDDSEAMFLGQAARRSSDELFRTARKALEAGDDPETVWRKTGIYQDPVDGKLRIEIPDSKAKLHGVEEWKEYKVDPTDPTDNDTLRMGDFLDHPELFDNYPGLADLEVQRGLTGENYGSFDGRTVKLNLDRPYEDILGTVLHELQHGVQGIEGFSPGGTDKMFNYKQANELVPKVRAARKQREDAVAQVRNHRGRLMELKRYKKDADDNFIYDADFNPELKGTPEEIKAQEETYEFWKKRRDHFQDRYDDAKELWNQHTPYYLYRRLGGENEASNVQFRLALQRHFDSLAPGEPGYGKKVDKDYYPPNTAPYNRPEGDTLPAYTDAIDVPSHHWNTMGEKHPYKSPYQSHNLAGIASMANGLDFAKLHNADTDVARMMETIAQEPGYNYGDILPVKRSTDPQVRENDPLGGYRPAIPNVGRDVIEALLKLKKQSDAGFFDPSNALEALL